MKRSLFFKSLCIILALCCFSTVFSACGNTDNQHNHDFKTLKFDNVSHWFECECGEKNNLAIHNIIDNSCICGFSNSQQHNHDFKTLKFDNISHWLECNCGEKNNIEFHKGGTPTSTNRPICFICQQEYGETTNCNYKWEIIEEPTCSKYGIKFGTCTICSDVVEVIIEKTAHDLTKGSVCLTCFMPINNQISIEADFEGGISVNEIKRTLSLLGQGLSVLSEASIEDFYLDNYNNLTILYEYSHYHNYIGLKNVVCNFNVETTQNKQITSIEVSNENNLSVFVSTDTGDEFFGIIDGKSIEKIFVSKNDVLCFVYSNGEALALGTIKRYSKQENLVYQVNENANECYVVGCIQSSENLVIPDYHDNIPVTRICSYAFFENTDIKTVKLGKNIRVVETNAFAYCSSLKEVYIPNNIIDFEHGAFRFNKIEKVYFEGSVSDLEKLYIGKHYNNTFYSCDWVYNYKFS